LFEGILKVQIAAFSIVQNAVNLKSACKTD